MGGKGFAGRVNSRCKRILLPGVVTGCSPDITLLRLSFPPLPGFLPALEAAMGGGSGEMPEVGCRGGPQKGHAPKGQGQGQEKKRI